MEFRAVRSGQTVTGSEKGLLGGTIRCLVLLVSILETHSIVLVFLGLLEVDK